ncbi:outer membrane lipoprotein-sorting protein, partial [Thiotrichales bacterium HSG1]|nr:outer membrane lipoprotein-sorting protein [Thiotrichales bacterium HSG1]
DGDKALTIFKQPRDIKGTAMLTWSHSIEADDQWLYLPALKRVKRISSKNKSGPFMGSEFAFEDLSSQEVDKYSYVYLRDENYNGIDCYVTERKPTYKHSGYTRQEVWTDKEHFNPQQIKFYDRKDALLKTLQFTDYKQYLDKYWRSDKMFMENHQTGKTTKLEFKNYEFGNKFTDRDFDKSTLKRAR